MDVPPMTDTRIYDNATVRTFDSRYEDMHVEKEGEVVHVTPPTDEHPPRTYAARGVECIQIRTSDPPDPALFDGGTVEWERRAPWRMAGDEREEHCESVAVHADGWLRVLKTDGHTPVLTDYPPHRYTAVRWDP